MTIQAEFGTTFPPEVAALLSEGAKDMSWHNDTCPSVGRWSDRCDLRLWCNHAVDWEPEIGSRYTVALYLNYADEPVLTHPTVLDPFDTDDPAVAIDVFVTTSGELQRQGLLT